MYGRTELTAAPPRSPFTALGVVLTLLCALLGWWALADSLFGGEGLSWSTTHNHVPYCLKQIVLQNPRHVYPLPACGLQKWFQTIDLNELFYFQMTRGIGRFFQILEILYVNRYKWWLVSHLKYMSSSIRNKGHEKLSPGFQKIVC